MGFDIEKVKKALSLSKIEIVDDKGEIRIIKSVRGKRIAINVIDDIRPKRLQYKAVEYICYLNCERELSAERRCLCGYHKYQKR